jgi:hypothetical protein
MLGALSIVGVDFETYFDREFSLSRMRTECYVQDPRFRVNGVAVVCPSERYRAFLTHEEFLEKLVPRVDWARCAVVGHNLAFDARILARRYGVRAGRWVDTLSMARPVFGHRLERLGLDFLSRHLGRPGKTQNVNKYRGMDTRGIKQAGLWEEYAFYGMTDVDDTLALFAHLLPFTPEGELRLIDWTIRQVTEPVIRVDRDALVAHLAEVQEAKDELLRRAELEDRAPLMSADRFVALLRRYGEDPEMKPGKRGPTYALAKTDDYMQGLLDHDDHRVQALAAARLGLKSTQAETRAKAFIEVSDACGGLLPAPIAYHAAHTGRYGGTDKLNLQNLKRGSPLRRALLPPPGKRFVVGDLSQIEARMVAWLSGQADLLEGFARDEDVYAAFASEVYGRPVPSKKVGGDSIERHVGKTAILGLGYGMGARKFCRTLRNQAPRPPDTGEVFGKLVVDTYRGKYRQIVRQWAEYDYVIKWMAYANNGPGPLGGQFNAACPRRFGELLAVASERLALPSGRALHYPGIRIERDDAESRDQVVCDARGGRERKYLWGGVIMENVSQALARDVAVGSQLALMDDFRLCLQVHDENVAVVDEDEAEDAREHMLRAMSTPPRWARDLPVAAEVKVMAHAYAK